MPAPELPALHDPYAVIAAIRRLARQYLIDDMDWREYYRGLVVALVGALKYDELDAHARRLVLVSAAAADKLSDTPLSTGIPAPTPAATAPAAAPETATAAPSVPVAVAAPVTPAKGTGGNRRWFGMALAVVGALLVTWAGWQFGWRGVSPGAGPMESATQSAVAGVTETPSPTASGGIVEPAAQGGVGAAVTGSAPDRTGHARCNRLASRGRNAYHHGNAR